MRALGRAVLVCAGLLRRNTLFYSILYLFRGCALGFVDGGFLLSLSAVRSREENFAQDGAHQAVLLSTFAARARRRWHTRDS